MEKVRQVFLLTAVLQHQPRSFEVAFSHPCFVRNPIFPFCQIVFLPGSYRPRSVFSPDPILRLILCWVLSSQICFEFVPDVVPILHKSFPKEGSACPSTKSIPPWLTLFVPDADNIKHKFLRTSKTCVFQAFWAGVEFESNCKFDGFSAQCQPR